MKDFYIQCLKDLESLTGIRQLFFLQSDPDGEKKKDIVINGMVEVSKKFPYIPEKYQQQIIRKMMVEDQSYDAINSRVVWKWLELHKNAYSQLTEEDLTAEHPPATPEQVAFWVNEFNKAMEKIGKPPEVNGMKMLRESKGYSEGITAKQPREKFVIAEVCNGCQGKGYWYGSPDTGGNPEQMFCEKCQGEGEINPKEVYAFNKEEAEKAYQASKFSPPILKD